MADDALPPPEPAEDAAPARRRSRVVGLRKPPPPVSAEAVALCEGLLDMARKGEIVEIMVVYADAAGATGNERTSIEFVAGMLGELRLVGDDLSEAARNE